MTPDEQRNTLREAGFNTVEELLRKGGMTAYRAA
jgi:hypothetical protein